MATLGEALQDLQVANGLDLAAVVTADGLVVDAASSSEVDADSLCAAAASGLLLMDALGQELGERHADITTLEYPGHIVVMTPLDDDNVLVLLAGAGMNLGRIRIILRRRRDELAQLLVGV